MFQCFWWSNGTGQPVRTRPFLWISTNSIQVVQRQSESISRRRWCFNWILVALVAIDSKLHPKATANINSRGAGIFNRFHLLLVSTLLLQALGTLSKIGAGRTILRSTWEGRCVLVTALGKLQCSEEGTTHQMTQAAYSVFASSAPLTLLIRDRITWSTNYYTPPLAKPYGSQKWTLSTGHQSISAKRI